MCDGSAHYLSLWAGTLEGGDFANILLLEVVRWLPSNTRREKGRLYSEDVWDLTQDKAVCNALPPKRTGWEPPGHCRMRRPSAVHPSPRLSPSAPLAYRRKHITGKPVLSPPGHVAPGTPLTWLALLLPHPLTCDAAADAASPPDAELPQDSNWALSVVFASTEQDT